MPFDRNTSRETLRRLSSSAMNPQEQIDELPDGIRARFLDIFEQNLKTTEYDSETVVQESLAEATKEFARENTIYGATFNAIVNRYERDGYDATLEYYENKEYSTIQNEDIYDIIEALRVSDELEFYKPDNNYIF